MQTLFLRAFLGDCLFLLSSKLYQIIIIKEPQGLLRPDGKRFSLTVWREGRCVTWDVTVTDTVAEQHCFLRRISSRRGGVKEGEK